MEAVRQDPLARDDLAQSRYAFSFQGQGGEYFRIWIVNILLTLLTLGIYSAWAKVRRERYFHRNTLLDDSAFEYHGNAWSILKGRLLVVGFLVVQNIFGGLSPVVAIVLSLVLLLATPWIICQAVRFRAANTSWRGVRLRFGGSAGGMARVYLLNGLLVLITLGIALPWWLNRFHRYIVSNLQFGSAPFLCEPPLRKYFTPLFVLMGYVLLFAIAGAALVVVQKFSPVPIDQGPMVLAVAIGVMLFYLGLLFIATSYVRSRISNAMWNHTSVQPAGQFDSSLSARSLFRIQLVNWLAIVLTLGLFIPFAKVRMARYRAETFALHIDQLDSFIAGQEDYTRALGEEAADLFDVDLGF